MDLYKDRDFIKTRNNLIFCVVGYVHPKDRVLAYLKYTPSSDGPWGGKDQKYSRSMSHYSASEVQKNINWLKENYPKYVAYLNELGFEMSSIPKDEISKHYVPSERLEEILSSGPTDTLEESVETLVSLISQTSGVPIQNFGVTGSILLKIHNTSFSDLDISVYGRMNSEKVKAAVERLFKDPKSVTNKLQGNHLEKWCREKAETYPISQSESRRFYSRRWNYGIFNDTYFSVHPTRSDNEVIEEYGDESYRGLGIISVEASISRVIENLYNPYRYKVEDVKNKNGEAIPAVDEIISFEGFYGGIPENGERVIAKGKLEEVIDKLSQVKKHRLVIGSPESKGKDFLKPIKLLDLNT